MTQKWVAALAILLVHGLLLFFYWAAGPKFLMGDEITYWHAAGRIAAGQPGNLPLLWPPLYAWFLASVRALLGDSILVVQLLQTAVLAGTAWMARDLATRLTGERWVGDIVGVLLLTYPPLVAFTHYLWPEIVHLGLFVAALWLLARPRHDALSLCGLGAVLGLALLTKSILGPFLPVLLAPLAWSGATRDRIRRVAVVLAVTASTVTPVMYSNWSSAGSFTVANSGWFNVWVGLNDRARKSFVQEICGVEFGRFQASARTFRERNAITRGKVLDLVSERGIVATLGGQLGKQYFRLLDKDSFLTDQLPGGAKHGAHRGYRDPPALLSSVVRGSCYALYILVLLGAIAGMTLIGPRRRRWLFIGLAFFAYNGALFLLLHVKSRYRIQMLPFLFLYAAIAARWLQLRLTKQDAPPWQDEPLPRPWAWATGAVSAALILFLALGGPALD